MAAQCATDSPHNPLWDFALALYDRPGVQACLLRLQDEAGMDVLLLLVDRWLMQQQRGWPAATALQAYLHWRDAMIVPLRTVRRRCDKAQQPLYGQLLQAELSAERQGLDCLHRVLQEAVVPRGDDSLLEYPPAFFTPANSGDADNKKEAVRPLFQQWLALVGQ